MRLIGISLLTLALLGGTAASAGQVVVAKTQGAAYLELFHGRGYSKIRSQGVVIGKIRRGRIVATPNVRLSENCDVEQAPRRAQMVQCRGRGIGFRTPGDGARWRVILRGRGINSAGVARGCLVLNGVNSGPSGQYRLGGSGSFHPWPRKVWRHPLGSGKC